MITVPITGSGVLQGISVPEGTGEVRRKSSGEYRGKCHPSNAGPRGSALPWRHLSMFDTTTNEIWLPIPGFETYYDVSNLGRIRAVDRVIEQKQWSGTTYSRRLPGRILAQGRNSSGYWQVQLSRGGVTKHYLVHRLALSAHRGVCPVGHQGRHLTDDQNDNRLVNLAWGLPEENIADRRRNGGYSFPRRIRCVKRGHALTTENTYVDRRGRRTCKACRAIQTAARSSAAA